MITQDQLEGVGSGFTDPSDEIQDLSSRMSRGRIKSIGASLLSTIGHPIGIASGDHRLNLIAAGVWSYAAYQSFVAIPVLKARSRELQEGMQASEGAVDLIVPEFPLRSAPGNVPPDVR